MFLQNDNDADRDATAEKYHQLEKNVSPRKKSLKVKEPSHHDVVVRKKPSQQEKKIPTG